ncbi:hypothetical protein CALCODRAFT_357746 [Calocera cornea HHB12733]|uniref:Uncharacterized protein n=1 Tax=Calocera cornea HHB12733 TaxID=1353952 RepID=A0A165EPH3_9BASI|nr:hypothetical protein CALCODRAFT_357746 [Calocera cornea HHB12733]
MWVGTQRAEDGGTSDGEHGEHGGGRARGSVDGDWAGAGGDTTGYHWRLKTVHTPGTHAGPTAAHDSLSIPLGPPTAYRTPQSRAYFTALSPWRQTLMSRRLGRVHCTRGEHAWAGHVPHLLEDACAATPSRRGRPHHRTAPRPSP